MADEEKAQKVQVDIDIQEVQDEQDTDTEEQGRQPVIVPQRTVVNFTDENGEIWHTETLEYDPTLNPISDQFDQQKFQERGADALAKLAEMQQTDPELAELVEESLNEILTQTASSLIGNSDGIAAALAESGATGIDETSVMSAVAAALSEGKLMLSDTIKALQTAGSIARQTVEEYKRGVAQFTSDVQKVSEAATNFKESFIMPTISIADAVKEFTSNMACQIATTLQSEEFKHSLEVARENAKKLAPLFPYIQIAYKEKYPDDPADLELDDLVLWLDENGEPAEEVADLIERAKELQAADAEKQTLPAVTVQRVENIEYPLDKISGTVWRLLEKDLQGQLALKAEKSGSKKEINLYFTIDFDELAEKGITISKRLTPFDKRVYIATAAIFNAGNTVTTLKQIYSAMGYTGRPGAEDLDKINDSLTKMSRASITLDNAEEAKAYKYDKFIYDGALLPMERGSAVVNGKIVDAAIHIFREPPLVSFAKQRKQITTLDIKLLQSPVSKTDDNLLIDDYLLDRLSKAKRSNKSVKILLKTLYDHANITTTKQKQRAPAKVKRYLEYYKECGFISKYTLSADSIIAYF